MFEFLKKRFRRRPAEKPAAPTTANRPASSFATSSSQAARSPPSADLLNPLNPLSPLSPFSPLYQVDTYEPPRSDGHCDTSSYSSYDSGSSYFSSDSCSSSSSSDSGSSYSTD